MAFSRVKLTNLEMENVRRLKVCNKGLRSAFRKHHSHERCDDVFFTLSCDKTRYKEYLVIKAERIEVAH